MFTLFTMPSATNTMASISEWSTEYFTQLLPLLYVAVGCIVGGLIVKYFIGKALAGVSVLTGKGKGGRGRRGRR